MSTQSVIVKATLLGITMLFTPDINGIGVQARKGDLHYEEVVTFQVLKRSPLDDPIGYFAKQVLEAFVSMFGHLTS